MGSQSDWETMQHAADQLVALGVPRTRSAWSVPTARRTSSSTTLLLQPGGGSKSSSLARAARRHPPGMCASKTPLPVLGVPVQSKALNGLDSVVHCPDARGRAGGDDGNREGGSHQRGVAGRRDAGTSTPRFVRPTRPSASAKPQRCWPTAIRVHPSNRAGPPFEYPPKKLPHDRSLCRIVSRIDTPRFAEGDGHAGGRNGVAPASGAYAHAA